jgi:hypothetical protein
MCPYEDWDEVRETVTDPPPICPHHSVPLVRVED